MHHLNDEDRKLLLDLFQFQGVQRDVDPPRFRLRHEEDMEIIDSLINRGYIREQTGRYALSLVSLEELKSPAVIELLDACDALWSKLQTHYRTNLGAQVPLSRLAQEAGLTIEIVRKAMTYMIEFPWYSGTSSGFPDHEDAAIGPQEKVIRLPTFRNAITELRSWKIAFQHDGTDRSLQFPVGKQISGAREARSREIEWHDDLQEPLATILKEIFGARSAGYRTIAAMGARAVIDLVCTDIAGDRSTFKQKMEEIHRLGYLSVDESTAVAAAFDAGSASAHRGYLIDERNLNNLIEIMEHLLRRRFRIGQVTNDIKANTPQRVRQKQSRDL